MEKYISILLCIGLVMVLPINSMAATQPFSFSREKHENYIEWSTKCTKSTDGERKFYVTITELFALNPNDTIYFGSRRVIQQGNSEITSGALSNGLPYTTSRDPRQSLSYFSDAYVPGGQSYVLNIKQSPNGPGAYALMDARWTP